VSLLCSSAAHMVSMRNRRSRREQIQALLLPVSILCKPVGRRPGMHRLCAIRQVARAACPLQEMSFLCFAVAMADVSRRGHWKESGSDQIAPHALALSGGLYLAQLRGGFDFSSSVLASAGISPVETGVCGRATCKASMIAVVMSSSDSTEVLRSGSQIATASR
jgi:hypothetical protein